MQITDYLNLYDSYLKTLVETNPTDFTKESLRQAVIDTVHQLTPYRLDEFQTNKTITTTLNKYKHPVKSYDGEIDQYEDSVDSNLLSALLLRYCRREKSFYHAYVRLQQEINGRVAFAENITFLSEQEIEDAVLEDMRLASLSKIEVEKQDLRFIDLLLSTQPQELLKLLHLLLDHTTNKKDFAIAIIALEQLGLLGKYGTKRNLYKTLQSEFTNIGTESNFNTYLNPSNRRMILNSEIESFIVPIKKSLNKDT